MTAGILNAATEAKTTDSSSLLETTVPYGKQSSTLVPGILSHAH